MLNHVAHAANDLLPFVQHVAGSLRFWVPDRSGSYAEATARGRAYAEQLLTVMRADDNPVLFGSVVRGISEGGVVGAVEIGFFSRIGIELIGLRPAP